MTMTRNYRMLLLALLLLCFARADVTYDTEECDACAFDGHDPDDCKVYGQMHTHELIAWSKGSQQCLNFYEIQERSFPHEVVPLIWPEGRYGPGNVRQLILLLQDPDLENNSALKKLKAATFSHFFEEQEKGTGGPVVFRDRVSVGETWFDCQSNNGADCWTAVREYLTSTEDGEKAIGYAYTALMQHIKSDLEREQQGLRVHLCHDYVNSRLSDVCGNLYQEVNAKMRTHVDADCASFGLGPENLKLTGSGCHLSGGGAAMEIRNGSAGSTAAASTLGLAAAAATLFAFV